MSSITPNPARLVTVFGGSGFVGRHTVRVFAQMGWRVRVACRRPDLAYHLQPLGRVGQISATQANVRYPASVLAAVKGADAVVNLVGVRMPKGRQSFESVHAFGARTIGRAARDSGVKTVLHVSAIGADANASSAYARSKAQGEAGILDGFADATIVRPSLIFGPEDDFFNSFAAIARISPFIPLFGGGQTKFQPVYVGDVARALAGFCDNAASKGKIYELGGPEVKTFEELMRFVSSITGRRRLFVPIPLPVANIQAFALELAHKLSLGIWPEWLTLTRDQVTLLLSDNIVSDAADADGRTLLGLGITPESIETIVPTYLYRFRKTGQFEKPHGLGA